MHREYLKEALIFRDYVRTAKGRNLMMVNV
jgi:hypothetical protein